MALALHRSSTMFARAVLVTSLLLPATAFADEETTSYRAYTLSADALGVALFLAGGLAEDDNGRDTELSGGLFATGALTLALAAPTIHFVRGHRGRAIGSWLMRSTMAGAGAILAITANSDCDDGMTEPGEFLGDDFLCELDYVGYGVLGGLVLASVIDAAFLTDEKVERAPGWAPSLTANRDGVRAGVAWQW